MLIYLLHYSLAKAGRRKNQLFITCILQFLIYFFDPLSFFLSNPINYKNQICLVGWGRRAEREVQDGERQQ